MGKKIFPRSPYHIRLLFIYHWPKLGLNYEQKKTPSLAHQILLPITYLKTPQEFSSFSTTSSYSPLYGIIYHQHENTQYFLLKINKTSLVSTSISSYCSLSLSLFPEKLLKRMYMLAISNSPPFSPLRNSLYLLPSTIQEGMPLSSLYKFKSRAMRSIRIMAEIRYLFTSSQVNSPVTPILSLPFNSDMTLDEVLSLVTLPFPYFVE